LVGFLLEAEEMDEWKAVVLGMVLGFDPVPVVLTMDVQGRNRTRENGEDP
jgi:hypothetical protein